jgi:hypothetical protein
LKVEDTLHDPD